MRSEVRGRIPCCAMRARERMGPEKFARGDEVPTQKGLQMQAEPAPRVDEAHVVLSDAMA